MYFIESGYVDFHHHFQTPAVTVEQDEEEATTKKKTTTKKKQEGSGSSSDVPSTVTAAVARYRAGTCFGEGCLLTHKPRALAAVAKGRNGTILRRLGRVELEALLPIYKDLATQVEELEQATGIRAAEEREEMRRIETVDGVDRLQAIEVRNCCCCYRLLLLLMLPIPPPHPHNMC